MRTVVSTEKAPAAIGPYSQGIIAGNYVFTAGQIPMDARGNIVAGDFKTKVRQVLNNLAAILEESGSDLKNVIKFTVFLTDLDRFGELNEVFAEVFSGDYPARSAVQVSRLPKDVDIEIEAIGLIPEK